MVKKKRIVLILALCLILSAFSAYAASNDSILFFPFDNSTNSSTYIYDASGTGNNGAKKANIEPFTTKDGFLGNATDYDGTNDYVKTAGKYIIPKGEQTIAFWIKTTQGAGNPYIISNNRFTATTDGTSIRVDAVNNELDVLLAYNGIREGYNYTSIDVTDGAWHHIVLTWDGTANDALIYHNGAYTSGVDMSAAGSTDASIDDFTIGISSEDLSTSPFDGIIDEILVYNYMFIEENVTNLYDDYLARRSPYSPPSITIAINSPSNNTEQEQTNFTADFNVSNTLGETMNCTLYIDGEANATKTGIVDGSNNVEIDSDTLPVGVYTWLIGCISSSIPETNSSSRTITIQNPTFECKYDTTPYIKANIGINDRHIIPVLCTIRNAVNETYKCTTTLKKNSELLQSNPVPLTFDRGIYSLVFDVKAIAYFTAKPANAEIQNVLLYYTNKRLRSDQTANLTMSCVSGTELHTATIEITPQYKDLFPAFDQAAKAVDNSAWYFMGFFGLVFLLIAALCLFRQIKRIRDGTW